MLSIVFIETTAMMFMDSAICSSSIEPNGIGSELEGRPKIFAEASLKTMERQAEDQCQKLHLTEIDLATERKVVLDLKAKLQKAKDIAQVAREAAEAAVRASYERRVHDTEARLVEEVAIVCKDYYTESSAVVLD